MNCEQLKERLSDYIDNSLDDTTLESVRTHLQSCEQCRRQADLLRQTVASVEKLPSIEPPDDFTRSVMETIRSKTEERPSRTPLWRFFPLPTSLKVSLQAATILVVSGFAVFVYLSTERGKVDVFQQEASRQRPFAQQPALEQNAGLGKGQLADSIEAPEAEEDRAPAAKTLTMPPTTRFSQPDEKKAKSSDRSVTALNEAVLPETKTPAAEYRDHGKAELSSAGKIAAAPARAPKELMDEAEVPLERAMVQAKTPAKTYTLVMDDSTLDRAKLISGISRILSETGGYISPKRSDLQEGYNQTEHRENTADTLAQSLMVPESQYPLFVNRMAELGKVVSKPPVMGTESTGRMASPADSDQKPNWIRIDIFLRSDSTQ
jgi:hypothetical protein